MKTFYSLDSLPKGPFIFTLGMFDGVHKGHQKIFQKMKDLSSKHSHKTLLVTFSNPPGTLLNQTSKQWITSLEHKLILFESFGIDYVLQLPFTPSFSKTSYTDFLKCFSISHLVIGERATIGYEKQGSIEALSRLGEKNGFSLESIPLEVFGHEISSTRIRQAIQQGNFPEITHLLGRPYSLYFSLCSHAVLPHKYFTLPPDGIYPVHIQTEEEIIPSHLSIKTYRNKKNLRVFPHIKKPCFCIFSKPSFKR
ncbi:MAG: FAD synthetase family protein [Chlamydiota bacterium]